MTIAAAWSNSSGAGCFAPATNIHGIPLSEDGLYIRDDLDVFPHDPGWYNINQWPLFKRAWAYQERRLSTCVLHFGKQQLFWECKSKLLSEENLEGLYLYPHDLKSSKVEEDPETGWRLVVQYYSPLKLTYEKDRLPAISACVKRIQRLRPDDVYIAGMWKKTLPYDLCWLTGPDNLLARPDNPGTVTPSWSWISTSTAASYHDEAVPLLSPDDVNVAYNIVGPAHIGHVSHASIHLKAHFMFTNSDSMKWSPWKIFEHPDRDWENDEPPIYCLGLHWDFDQTTADPPMPANIRLIALPLMIIHHGDCFGIVLRELANKQFERVGHFTGSSNDRTDESRSVERMRENIVSSIPIGQFTIV